MQLHEITFQPDGVKVKTAGQTTIWEAGQRAGIILNSVCGGAGTCGKCLVYLDGQETPVRACQYRVDRDLVVTIPESSRFFEQKILQEGISSQAGIEPLVCKHYLQLAGPTLEDLRSDSQRLIAAVDETAGGAAHTCRDHAGTVSGRTRIANSLLRQLPALFREHNYAVTAVCHSGRIFAMEPGDTTGTMFGLAVDIGTTTVVASLLNLVNGKTVGIAAQSNPQIPFGDDVVSRIEYSRANPDGLRQLQHRMVDCLNQFIADLCKKTLVQPWQIYELTAAGNATMQHLFLGVPVEQIAQAPYVAAFSEAVNVPARELGINIHPQGNVYVMPSVAAHIGGDTVAVGLSTAMKFSEEINLAIDIGTNGEIILGNRDRLVTCSTAAGPAFEGARISCGMRGAAGAIERLYMNQDVECGVIGEVPPTGICGSGLIDSIAELLNIGLLDPSGRLLSRDEIPAVVPPKIRTRLIETDTGPAFTLAYADQTKHGKPILLTQRDIREAQLGKAAIAAGVATLMHHRQMQPRQIGHLYLAGAFGNYIRPESARRIGLLPDLPLEKILFIGNAASTGAREVLLSRQARYRAEQLAREMEYVELAGRPDFQNLFADCMFFPEK